MLCQLQITKKIKLLFSFYSPIRWIISIHIRKHRSANEYLEIGIFFGTKMPFTSLGHKKAIAYDIGLINGQKINQIEGIEKHKWSIHHFHLQTICFTL
jgi:hypothetical protein